MKIRVQNVSKNFGNFTALDNVSLEIPSGKLVALLGPSGSGKTTLLRIIAGLDAPDAGRIFYGDDDVTAQNARTRGIGFVFQHYALFGHMTVFENVAFGLRVRKEKKPQIAARVRELLSLVQLDGLENRLPTQLSGGQRQRVALARALAADPKFLMLDEPFGALDAKVRAELRRWIRELHDEIHLTSLFVTHDQEEAFEVADYVVVMSNGRVEQVGTPDEVFAAPANAFVTDFLGRVNVFRGQIQNQKLVLDGDLAFALDQSGPKIALAGELSENANGENAVREGAPVSAFIRPHEIEISRQKTANHLHEALVSRVNGSGSTTKVALVRQNASGENARGFQALEAEISHETARDLKLAAHERVWFSPNFVRVFAAPN